MPALHMLLVTAPIVGQLAPEWAHGFRQLTSLTLSDTEGVPGGKTAAAVPSLPAEWAAGFPALTKLKVSVQVEAGSIPMEWLEGGFPELTVL